MTKQITIAVPKGYLLKETIKKFEAIGIHFPSDFEESRRLFTYDTSKTKFINWLRDNFPSFM